MYDYISDKSYNWL